MVIAKKQQHTRVRLQTLRDAGQHARIQCCISSATSAKCLLSEAVTFLSCACFWSMKWCFSGGQAGSLIIGRSGGACLLVVVKKGAKSKQLESFLCSKRKEQGQQGQCVAVGASPERQAARQTPMRACCAASAQCSPQVPDAEKQPLGPCTGM